MRTVILVPFGTMCQKEKVKLLSVTNREEVSIDSKALINQVVDTMMKINS